MIDDQTIETLKQTHGPKLAVADDLGLVLRPPTLVEAERFTDRVTSGEANKAQLMRDLVLTCVVHPAEKAEAKSVLDGAPFAIADLSLLVQELGGSGTKTRILGN